MIHVADILLHYKSSEITVSD